MTTLTSIKEAIGRSISHTEIVKVIVPMIEEALQAIDNDENVEELDWSRENDGSMDVYGKRLGADFRLRLVQE